MGFGEHSLKRERELSQGVCQSYVQGWPWSTAAIDSLNKLLVRDSTGILIGTKVRRHPHAGHIQISRRLE